MYEFERLYNYVNQWLTVFKTYDRDQSGSIEGKDSSFYESEKFLIPKFLISSLKQNQNWLKHSVRWDSDFLRTLWDFWSPKAIQQIAVKSQLISSSCYVFKSKNSLMLSEQRTPNKLVLSQSASKNFWTWLLVCPSKV